MNFNHPLGCKYLHARFIFVKVDFSFNKYRKNYVTKVGDYFF